MKTRDSKEDTWRSLYELEVLSQEPPVGLESTSKLLHEFMQRLYDDGKLRTIDICRLESIMELVYKIGKAAGREEMGEFGN